MVAAVAVIDGGPLPGDTSGFTHRSPILVVNERGVVWLPQRLSKQAWAALATLDPDSPPDFYHRFRALAGLPDGWEAQRAPRTPLDGDAYRIITKDLISTSKLDGPGKSARQDTIVESGRVRSWTERSPDS